MAAYFPRNRGKDIGTIRKIGEHKHETQRRLDLESEEKIQVSIAKIDKSSKQIVKHLNVLPGFTRRVKQVYQ